tara:strand:- start:642 stop:1031 length:390 start_codon:yes stop_codon:yes gene_type:complete
LPAINTFQDILLVSIGAVFGVNSRFIIHQRFKQIDIKSDLITLLINTSSSFFLGLFISILTRIRSLNFSSQLALFFLIGFLGSLSTFSTFVYDLLDLFLKSHFLRALKLFIFSFSLGIIALALGLLLGN